MADFIFTQSALKDLEKPDTCPYRWEQQWLHKAFKMEPTDRMMAGSYFEYLCLGSGAREGEDITDLPRLRGDKKSTSQLRIEEQAEIFTRMHTPGDPAYMGWRITEKQLYIEDGDKKRGGTIDYMAEAFQHPDGIPDGTIAVFDLKFTGDVNSEWGDYCWGKPERMDLIQQVLYRELGMNSPFCQGQEPLMYLLLFDDSPNLGRKLLQIEVSKEASDKMENRFYLAAEAAEHYQQHGFPKIPGRKECAACPLQCELAFNQERTDIIKVMY